jgi:hypothetical protein
MKNNILLVEKAELVKFNNVRIGELADHSGEMSSRLRGMSGAYRGPQTTQAALPMASRKRSHPDSEDKNFC